MGSFLWEFPIHFRVDCSGDTNFCMAFERRMICSPNFFGVKPCVKQGSCACRSFLGPTGTPISTGGPLNFNSPSDFNRATPKKSYGIYQCLSSMCCPWFPIKTSPFPTKWLADLSPQRHPRAPQSAHAGRSTAAYAVGPAKEP